MSNKKVDYKNLGKTFFADISTEMMQGFREIVRNLVYGFDKK